MAKTKKDFTTGNIFPQMLFFSIPLILSGLIQQLYSVADNIIVGKFSGDPLALAAVGTTSSISSLFLNLAIGFSTGCSVVVSHAIGARNDALVKKVVHTAMTLALILGIAVAIPGAILADKLLIMVDTPADILPKSTLYLRIIFLGFPASVAYNFASSILRAGGDSKNPMYSLIGSGTTNVILNLVFVVGCGMSVAGVAIATIISQYVSAVYCIFVLIKDKEKPYAFYPKQLTFDVGVFNRMMRLGLPAGLQSCMFSISNLMFTAAINTLSTAAISAKAIFIDIILIANAISASYNSSSMTFSGQNYGARKPKRIVRSFLCATAQSVAIVFTVCMIILAAIEPIASMYVAADDPMRLDVIAEITATASVIMPLYFISCIMNTLSGTIRGMGVSLSNMLIYVIGVSGVRIGWVLTAFKLPMFNSLAGLYTSWPVSWCVVITGMSILYVITLRKMKKEIKEEA